MHRNSSRPRESSQSKSKSRRQRRDDTAIAQQPQHEEQDGVSRDEQLIGAERYARKGDDVIWDDRF